jgi:3-dehydroquinate dehydratase-2
MRVLVLNGPNLNLLGERETVIYGNETLTDVNARIRARADELGIEVAFEQSNHEGALIDTIQAHRDWDAMILNAAGYTHTSVAIADAISGVALPTVEVHISNIFEREAFRHHSYIEAVAMLTIVGHGTDGYIEALEAIHERLGTAGASEAVGENS